jgi:hypothetical protein
VSNETLKVVLETFSARNADPLGISAKILKTRVPSLEIERI